MDSTAAVPIVVALISGILGGVIVALVNNLLTRNKQNAEVDKLRAETEKIRLETAKLNGDVENLSATVSYQLAESSERILYDSSEGLDLHDFNAVEGRAWNEQERKSTGPKAAGSLAVADGHVLNVQRSNTEGRFEIWLDSYTYNDKTSAVIPANELLAGNRKLRVSFQAKAVDSSHTLDILLKDAKSGAVPLLKSVVIDRNDWTAVNMYFQISPRLDLALRIYDTLVSRAPSSLQLRNLVVAERNL